MSRDEYTLEELSQRTGVEARTLRSWVSEGLLSPPLKQGRGARYPASNADRALAVRVLKDLHGFSFTEISRRFMMASDEEIRAWASEAGPIVKTAGSARDYIKTIRERSHASGKQNRRDISGRDRAVPPPLLPRQLRDASGPSRVFEKGGRREAELASLEKLIFQLEQALEAPAPRRSRGSIWTRIRITPDLELSVRGELDPAERVLFEQLADQLRAILTGRSKHD